MTLRFLPRAKTATAERRRVWEAGRVLRRGRRWVLKAASVERSWTVVIEKRRIELLAFFSFFFEDSGRGPAAVFSIHLTPASAATEDCVTKLQERLGDGYRRGGGNPSLTFVLRTDRPTPILAEVERIGRLFGDAATRTVAPRPSARSAEGRLWEILERLRRRRGWQVNSLSFVHALGGRGLEAAGTVSLLSRSADDRAGTGAFFFGHSTLRPRRWAQYCDDVWNELRARGYRSQERTRRTLALSQFLPTLRVPVVRVHADLLARLVDGAR